MRQSVFFVIALLTGCSLLPDGEDCALIACADGVTVDFEATEQGSWTVELDVLDGTTVVDTITCTADLPIVDSQTERCDHPDYHLHLSGSELPDSDHAITGISTHALPEAFDIRILHDGSEQLLQTVEPEYQTVLADDPTCGSGCTSAFLTLELL